MNHMNICNRCKKRVDNCFKNFGGCKCTGKQIREHNDEEFKLMQKHFDKPSIESCIEIFEGNGYRVSKLKRALKVKRNE